jgi:hypothetical protein
VKKPEPAMVHQLSPSLEAVVSKRGVTLLRGKHVFVFTATEGRNLAAAIAAGQAPSPGPDHEPEC